MTQQRWRLWALSTGVALGVVALAFALGTQPLVRDHFGLWVPLVSWGGLLLLLASSWLAERAQRWLSAALVGLALASCGLATARYLPAVLALDSVRVHTLFHYYIGTKYFHELGYDQLYAAAVVADSDWARAHPGQPSALSKVRKVSDLRSYRARPRRQIEASFDRSLLSPERLVALNADLRALDRFHPDWRPVLSDLGYNPAPPWLVLGRPITRWLPPEGPGLWLMANSDLPLLVGTIVALWWGWGTRSAALGLIFLTAIPFNHGRLTGGLLQYDWLLSAVLGLAAYRRGFGALGGVVLSWAAMTRVFPALLALPPLIRLVRALAKGRSQPLRRRFALGFAVGCGLLLLASCFTGRGPGVWLEWRAKIATHVYHHPYTSVQRLGAGRWVQQAAPSLEHPVASLAGNRDARRVIAVPRLRLVQLLGLALLLPVLWRRDDHDAMVMMLFVAFLFTVSSRYYGSIWLLMATLGVQARGQRISREGRLAAALMVAMPGVFYLLPMSDNAGRYLLVNDLALLMFALPCVLWWRADLRAWRARSLQLPAQ